VRRRSQPTVGVETIRLGPVRVRHIGTPSGPRVYRERMAELKTLRNDASVAEFLGAVTDPQRRADAQAVCALMAEVTGAQPAMWGNSIVGFGAYHYKYASGREGDWPAVGLSPRKQSLTIYISEGFDSYEELLGRLGPHSTGKSCLYIKRLSDVDERALRSLVERGFQHLNGKTVTSEPRG
jgi:hypothetical protein